MWQVPSLMPICPFTRRNARRKPEIPGKTMQKRFQNTQKNKNKNVPRTWRDPRTNLPLLNTWRRPKHSQVLINETVFTELLGDLHHTVVYPILSEIDYVASAKAKSESLAGSCETFKSVKRNTQHTHGARFHTGTRAVQRRDRHV